MNVAAWMSRLSLNSSADEEARRQSEANRPAQPKTMMVDRWNGTAWEQHLLVWDGAKYVPESQQ